MIRIGCRGIFHFNYNKESPPKPYSYYAGPLQVRIWRRVQGLRSLGVPEASFVRQISAERASSAAPKGGRSFTKTPAFGEILGEQP